MPKKVFISYRREDTAAAAGRVYDRLSRLLSKPNVFFDVSTIGGGEDFAQRIASEIGKSDAALVFIGDKWLEKSSSGGGPRLCEPDDYVRAELRAALSRPVLVVPVLVGGARMPRPEQLPEDVRAVATKNALPLRHESFDEDTENIVPAVLGLKATGAGVGGQGIARRQDHLRPWRRDFGRVARCPRCPVAFLADGAPAVGLDRRAAHDADHRRRGADRRLPRLALQDGDAPGPVMRFTHRPGQTRSARRRSLSARSPRDCAARAPTSGIGRNATAAGARRACRTDRRYARRGSRHGR